jgi:hypothetical protein
MSIASTFGEFSGKYTINCSKIEALVAKVQNFCQIMEALP